MSNSVHPHRWQPTRLPSPWDSPGKNTGVGYHFLLQCMKVKSESEVIQLCRTLSDHMDSSPPGSSVHGTLQARVLEWGAIAFFYNAPAAAAAAAKSLQSCPTLCDPMDGSPPGSPVRGILQARTLKWVAISFSSAWKWKVKGKLLSRVRLLVTPWTAAHQAPPSVGFSRQEYWSGVPSPSPIDFLILNIYKENKQDWCINWTFCKWLLSLSIKFSKFIRVVPCINISLLLFMLN